MSSFHPFKKFLQAYVMDINYSEKIFKGNITAFFYAPVVSAVKVIMNRKILIRSKPFLQSERFNSLTNRSDSVRTEVRLLHRWESPFLCFYLLRHIVHILLPSFKMRCFFTSCVILLLFSQLAFSQDWKRTQNWYFGDKAGLSFATEPPTALTDGQMGAIEGCATISDTAGNLLFYTEGNNVWNRNHQIMPNGTGLLGHGSSTQAALIVPQPGNDSLFFVFTTAQKGQPNGFRYSLVNMNLNGGLGDVTTKNVLLQTPVCEKLTATKHANGRDIWVLAHGFGNDLFYAYLVTEHGIVDCPVVSQIGSVHSNGNITNAQGAMKFSISGRLLGVSVYDINQQKTDLFDFDASTGGVSNYRYIPWVNLGYGLEFSPNERYIYISTRLNNMYQYDISSNIGDTIKSTEYRIYSYSGPSPLQSYYTSFQLSSNNRIYIALVDSSFIGVINYPDSSGMSCGFEENGVDLSPKKSKDGFSNFVSSYFYRPSADFGYELDCQTYQITLKAVDTIGAISYRWNISKSSVQSFTGNPLTFTFPDTGEFTVELLAINSSDTARQRKTIFVQPTYTLDLGNDTVLCSGEQLTLDAGGSQHCYLWNDSGTGSTLTVDTTGLYLVKVVSKGFCTYFDSIRVSFIPEPLASIQITRKADTLFADQGFDRYTWLKDNNLIQDSTLNYLILGARGNYKVTGSDSLGCFTTTSTLFIVDTFTSLQAIGNSGFRVYPNPSRHGQELTIESQEPIGSIEVYNQLGQHVYTESRVEANTYPLKNLNRGIYIVVLNQTHYAKIIVH